MQPLYAYVANESTLYFFKGILLNQIAHEWWCRAKVWGACHILWFKEYITFYSKVNTFKPEPFKREVLPYNAGNLQQPDLREQKK